MAWAVSACYEKGWQLPLAGAGHVVLFIALFLLSGAARAQLAAVLFVALMVASYFELKQKGTPAMHS